VQNIGASLPEYFLHGMAKESLCGMVPETDFARLPDGKDRIRCVFEKGEQFRFQHVHILDCLTSVRWKNRNGVPSIS
jgi:hypothetical protein